MARYEAVGDLSRGRRRDRRRDARRGRRDRLRGDRRPRPAGRASAWRSCRRPSDRPVQILTHCNTGPLACGQFGTALGIVQAAHHAERPIHVWVDETRPYLQGARLTTWELAQAGVAAHADPRRRRRPPDGPRRGRRRSSSAPTGSRPTATRPTRSARTRWPCWPRATASRSTSARRSVDRRPRDARRRGHPDRGAPRRRGPRGPRPAHRPARHGRPQPGLRRHPGRAHHRDRHRGGRRSRAPFEAGLAAAVARRELRRASPPSRPSAGGRTGRRRRRPSRIVTTVALGRRSRGGRPRRRPTGALLRAFLEQDRLYAAYAICDLEEREFARTRWGVACDGDELVAVVLEYTGPTPQPLFVDGPHRTASRRSCATSSGRAPRTSPRAPAMLPGRRGALPGRPRAADGPDVGRPRALPAVPGDRPAAAARSRSASSTGSTSSGFASWLPSSAIADGVYYGMRVNGQLVAAAGTHVVSRERRLAVVGNVLTHVDYRGRGFATAVDRRRDRRAAADVRPGRAQRPRRQPAGPQRLSPARLRRARPLRGAPRPPPRLALARPRRAAAPPLRPQGDPIPDDRHRHPARPRRHRPRPRRRGRPADRVGRARDARPAPHPRALRARAAARRPAHRRLPPRHDRDGQPDAHAQGRRRRGRAGRVATRCRPRTTSPPRSSPSTASRTFARRGEDRDTYYAHLNAVADTHPQITMDDGCDLVSLLHSERPDQVAEVLAGTEETTTGVIRLKAMAADGALGFPVMAVNEAQTKHLFDNRYGTGQSTRRRHPARDQHPHRRAQGRRRRLRLGRQGDRRRGWPATAPTSRSSRSTRSARSRR